jgi:hypothetical protein
MNAIKTLKIVLLAGIGAVALQLALQSATDKLVVEGGSGAAPPETHEPFARQVMTARTPSASNRPETAFGMPDPEFGKPTPAVGQMASVPNRQPPIEARQPPADPGLETAGHPKEFR